MMSKGKSLRDVGRSTAAQAVMKTEMLRPKLSAEAQRVKSALEQSDHVDFDEADSVDFVHPVKLDAVLGAVIGDAGLSKAGKFERGVPEMAYGIINRKAPHLQLSLEQWQLVQGLIEEGLRVGYTQGTFTNG